MRRDPRGQAACWNLLGSELSAVSRPAAARPSVPQQHAHPPLDESQVRVLVVDDSPMQRFVMRTMLRKLGVAAEEAADGAEALERVATAPFDVVLLDCRMPGLDGYATAKALSAAPCPPWIAGVSADDDASDLARAAAAGMRDYLVKPVDMRTLEEALARARGAR